MWIDSLSFIFDITIMLLYFHTIFEERKKQISFAIFLIILLCCECVLFMSTYYLTYAVTGEITQLITLISTFIIFAQTLLYEGTIKHRIFVTISYQVYCTIAEILIFLIFSLLPENLASALLGNNTFCLLASKFILFLLVIITNLVFLRKKKKLFCTIYCFNFAYALTFHCDTFFTYN